MRRIISKEVVHEDNTNQQDQANQAEQEHQQEDQAKRQRQGGTLVPVGESAETA